MATIVTRAGKGAPLTHTEVDANFTNLNTDKIQSGDTVASLDINGGTIDGTVIGGSTPAAISGTTGSFSGAITSGDITITDTFPLLSLVGTTGGATWNQLVVADGSYQIRSGSPARLNIATNGDISFYEDTGTTPKFFWDASAEALGIGTSSPSAKLHIEDDAGGALRIENITPTSISSSLFLDDTGAGLSIISYGSAYSSGSFLNVGAGGIALSSSTDMAINAAGTKTLRFGTNNTERMRITSTGSVQIGSSSGNTNKLFVYDNSSVSGVYVRQDGAGPIQSWHGSGGGELMRITSTGDVGIGTAAPSYTAAGRGNLNIAGSSGAILGFQIGGTAKGYVFHDNTNLQLWSETAGSMLFATSATERMRITSTGSVGIGTSSPSSDAIVRFVNVSDATSAGFVMTAPRKYSIFSSSSSTLSFRDETAAATRMLIDSSGNVGIGTSSPTEKLTVLGNAVIGGTTTALGGALSVWSSADGTVAAFRNGGAGTQRGLYVGVNNTTGDVSLDATGSSGGNLVFATGGGERMRITSTGNVGIGTSSITSGVKMQVQSTGGTVLSIKDTTSGSGDYSNIWFGDEDAEFVGFLGYNHGTDAMTFGTNSTERARIDASGNLLVGTTTAVDGGILSVKKTGGGSVIGAQVGVNSNYVLAVANQSGSIVGGVIANASTTSYATSSDYRLKENVVPLAGAADRLAQIPVHRFNFIAAPDRTVDGFLAHEVQEFVPEAVTGEKDAVDKDGKPVYQGIDQSKLTPLITAALQETLKRIEALETEIQAMKAAGNA